MKFRPLFITLCTALVLGHPALAQETNQPAADTPAAQTGEGAAATEEKPLVLTQFEVVPKNAPGGGDPWLKLNVAFSTKPKWSDGIMFSYNILLTPKDPALGKPRVVRGSVRYANIPAGNHFASLYLSPNTARRYGGPAAAQIVVYSRDDEAGTLNWTAPGADAPKDWQDKFDTTDGILLPLNLTPFITTDYADSPDLMSSSY